jgi:CAAX prenyl protease-like protein
MSDRKKLIAYTLPMLSFLALVALNGLLKKIDHNVWLDFSEYWIYPLQTILCGLLLIRFWPEYSIARPRRVTFGFAVGIAVFVLWISQTFLGFSPRTNGFNPLSMFGNQSFLYWSTVIFRFLRLVVVVPLVEEIFWRGFLLRYLINEKFDQVPFGAFSWLSFAVVTLLFALSHSPADWIAALLTGALYNLVAYRTKSLSTCVLTHATTNLLLGLWIMHTRQWGFW